MDLIVGDSTQSLILASSGSTELLLEAHSLGMTEPFTRAFDLAGSEALCVLSYDSTLESLGLPSGILELEPEGGPLPPPDRIFELGDEGERAEGFVEVATVPAHIASAHLAATHPCGRFTVEALAGLAAAPPARPTFAVELDETRALLGLEDGRTYVVDANGLEATPGPLNGRSFVTAVSGRDGEIWLGGSDGVIARGSVEGGFSTGPALPLLSGESPRLVSSPTHVEFELYAATSSMALFRLDGASWTMLHDRTGGLVPRSRLDAVWIAPGKVAVIGGATDVILELSETEGPAPVRIELPLRPTTDSLHATAWLDGWGPVVGTRYSTMLQRTEVGWTLLPPPSVTPIVHALLDLGDGSFIAGGEASVLARWLPGKGQCPPLPLPPHGGNLQFVVRLGSGFMAVSQQEGDATAVSLYRRR